MIPRFLKTLAAAATLALACDHDRHQPPDFAAFVQKERRKYGALVKASGAKVD
jgi:hypothetical protein